MSVQGDVHVVEAFKNWCPLCGSWLEELYSTELQARDALRYHLHQGRHWVSTDRIKLVRIEKDGSVHLEKSEQ